MKVTLTATISGTRNGQAWPLIGESVDLPEGEAKDMILAGQAVPYVKPAKVETATLSTPERAEPVAPDATRPPEAEVPELLQPVPAVGQDAPFATQVPHQPGTPEALKAIPITTDEAGNEVATDEAVAPIVPKASRRTTKG